MLSSEATRVIMHFLRLDFNKWNTINMFCITAALTLTEIVLESFYKFIIIYEVIKYIY